MIRTILFVLLSVFLTIEGVSQEFILDKPFYISGEAIQYSIIDDAKITRQVLFVELRSSQNVIIDFQKIIFDGQLANGTIALPVDAPYGYYRMALWTDMNKPPAYKLEVPVYNERISNEVIQSNPSPRADSSLLSAPTSVFAIRDTVRLRYGGEEGRASLVVVNSALGNRYIPSTKFKIRNSLDSMIVLEGTLTASNGELVNSGLISVYAVSSKTFHRAVVINGELSLKVPDYNGSQLFQIFNLDPYQEQIPEFTLRAPEIADYQNTEIPPFYDYVASYLVNHKKIQKINELFPFAEDEPAAAGNEFVPDKVYLTKDYQEMGSFTEFINEAVVNAKVSTKKEPTIKLFNPEVGERFVDHPWFMVDGLMTYDESFVLNIDIKDIQEIRLYVNTSTIFKYFEPFMLRNGVIEIRTRDVKYAREIRQKPNVVDMLGLTKYQQKVDQILLDNPYVKDVLFWDPDVTLSKDTLLKIPLTDNTGEYTILLRGISSGKSFSTQRTIQILPKINE